MSTESQMIALKLDVSKIEKKHFYQGKEKQYLNLLLIPRESKFGDSHCVIQSVSKEAKAAGERGNIIGNGRWVGKKPQGQVVQSHDNQAPRDLTEEDDDKVPF